MRLLNNWFIASSHKWPIRRSPGLVAKKQLAAHKAAGRIADTQLADHNPAGRAANKHLADHRPVDKHLIKHRPAGWLVNRRLTEMVFRQQQ